MHVHIYGCIKHNAILLQPEYLNCFWFVNLKEKAQKKDSISTQSRSVLLFH